MVKWFRLKKIYNIYYWGIISDKISVRFRILLLKVYFLTSISLYKCSSKFLYIQEHIPIITVT